MNLLRPESEEFSLLGIVIGGKASDLRPVLQLSAGDFSNSNARTLFEGIQAIMLRQEAVTAYSLNEELTRKHGSERARELMASAIDAAAANIFNAWSLPNLVSVISEAAHRRHLIKVGEALSRAAADEQRDMLDVLESTRSALQKGAQSDNRIVRLTDACLDAYDAAFNQEKPIPTRIKELDAVLCGGLHCGEFTILGARGSW